MASDNAFAMALLNVWHRVAEVGQTTHFTPPVNRLAVGTAVAVVIDGLRSGRVFAFAAAKGREVIGFAALRPGTGAQAHTGHISLLMVDPAHQGGGTEVELLQSIIELARARELEQLQVTAREGIFGDSFYGEMGFREVGRLPNWIRTAQGQDCDEVLMVLEIQA